MLCCCFLQERAECSAELSAAQLSKIVVGPRCIDFGKASPALPSSQCFVVTNHLNAAIHVVLDLCGIEGLSCSSPAAQVIPAGSTAKFQLALHCRDVRMLKEKIQYCINGCHMQVGTWQPACPRFHHTAATWWQVVGAAASCCSMLFR
jgi:hypothetical protein